MKEMARLILDSSKTVDTWQFNKEARFIPNFILRAFWNVWGYRRRKWLRQHPEEMDKILERMGVRLEKGKPESKLMNEKSMEKLKKLSL